MSEPPETAALSERTRRQVDRLLDEAEQAISTLDWATVRDRARAALALDLDNQDGRNYLAAAERELAADATAAPSPVATGEGGAVAWGAAEGKPGSVRAEPVEGPSSFVSGRYRVAQLLGEGATKRVYRAYDTKLDRDIAFALIKTDGLDVEGLTRIRREAQAMARLGDHPHIVTVFDIGEEGDQPFIISQFMAGGDLQTKIEQAPERHIPLEQALSIGGDICAALEHAHTQGVIHRDLKPGNVWLSGGSPSPQPSTSGEGAYPPPRAGGR